MAPYSVRVTTTAGTGVSPRLKLMAAAGSFLAATLILIINFLVTPPGWVGAKAGAGNLFYLAPLALAVYYTLFAVVRARPEREAVVVTYKPPNGISPAQASYLYTLGCDGRTYVACIVSLAARGLVAIEPAKDGVYLRSAVEPPGFGQAIASVLPAEVPEEERCVFHDLFHQREIAFLKPPPQDLLDRITLILERRTSAAYHDFGAVFTAGVLVMSVTALGMASTQGLLKRINGDIDLEAAAFLTISLFSAGLASAFFWQHNRRAVLLAWRGIYRYRTLTLLAGALFIMPGLFWLPMHLIAPAFADVTVLMLLVNTFARPFLIRYTTEGSRVMRQLLGFRRFLESTEQDRLERLHRAGEDTKPDFLLVAYAIALDIRESWGDRLGVEAMVETAFDRAF